MHRHYFPENVVRLFEQSMTDQEYATSYLRVDMLTFPLLIQSLRVFRYVIFPIL